MKIQNPPAKATRSRRSIGVAETGVARQTAQWPVAYRWLATGALAVYSALGVQLVQPALAQGPQSSQGPTTQARLFQIPASPLDDAIDRYEAATGLTVSLARAGLANVQSPGVFGTFTAEEALDRLLRGTGVVVLSREGAKVSLDLAGASSSVEVVETPRLASPKYSTPLVDTPQMISIIPEKTFAEQGARNLTDVLRNTPGITFEAGENGFATGTSNFSMRGIDTSGNIFVDGARDSGSFLRDVFNVEQVEIVKGPSADNGRGGAGGYLNLTTKAPVAESFHRVFLSYGFDQHDSRNRPRVSYDMNHRIGEQAGLRLNALWDDGGVIGRQFAERKTWGLAPSFSYGLGKPTRLSAGYQVVGQNDIPDWGIPAAAMPGMQAYSPTTGGKRYRNRFYGLSSDFDDVTSHALVGRFEHDLSNGTRFRNVLRWADAGRQALYAVPTGYTAATQLVATQRQAYVRDNGSVSNMANLEVPFRTGQMQHTLTTGVELTKEGSNANRYPTDGILGVPGSTALADPNPSRTIPTVSLANPTQRAEVDIRTAAAYLYDTIHLSRHWLFSGGLRLERYRVQLDSLTAAGAPQGPNGYRRTDTMLNGRVGLTYKPVEAGSFYASWGVSTLPPASFLSNTDISREGDNAFPGWMSGPNSATAKLQRARNYEAGTKWSLARSRLITSAALFRTLRTNVAMAGTLNGVPNAFAGYGEQVLQGVELGASGSLTRNWSITAGLLLMDSERRHSAQVDLARITANPADYGTATTTNGDQLAFTPKTSGTLWTTYRFPKGITLGGGIRHVGDSYLGRPDNAERVIANGRFGKLPGYTVGDLMAAYQVNRRLTLRFNMDNLTDAYYPISSNWGGSRILLGATRNFRISTDISF